MGRSRAIAVALVTLFASQIVEPARAATERSPSPARADPGAMTLPFSATMTEPIAGGVTRRHGRWATTDGQQVIEYE